MKKIRRCIWLSLIFLVASCKGVVVEQTETSVYQTVTYPTLPARSTASIKPTMHFTQTLLAACRPSDLLLEVNTMPAPKVSTVIRVVLYAKENRECQIETPVNFRLETENGKLLPIEGNNGLAFSKGYVRSNNAESLGVGDDWTWQNFCQETESKIILFGSAGGLQAMKFISVIPSCFDSKESSEIKPFRVVTSNQVIEWQGTITPTP